MIPGRGKVGSRPVKPVEGSLARLCGCGHWFVPNSGDSRQCSECNPSQGNPVGRAPTAVDVRMVGHLTTRYNEGFREEGV